MNSSFFNIQKLVLSVKKNANPTITHFVGLFQKADIEILKFHIGKCSSRHGPGRLFGM